MKKPHPGRKSATGVPATDVCSGATQPPPSSLSAQIVMLLLLGISHGARARDTFDPRMLSLGGGDVPATDLSIFSEAGSQAPGDYLVDIYINNNFHSTRKVSFSPGSKGELLPALTPRDYEKMGVDIAGLASFKGLPADKPVANLPTLIPMSSVTFDFALLRLNISVPQASMRSDSGRVDPTLWQEGMPAFLLNYNFNGSQSRRDSQYSGTGDNSNLFGNFRSGLNVGPWRARSNFTWTHNRQEQNAYDNGAQAISKAASTQDKWTFLDRYVQRDIQALQGELTAGDTNTGNTASQVFDGFSYRGASLASSDAMQPSNLTTFAPIITGTANSNAQVTIRQNGNIIYQSWVPAGPFRISDLGGGGTGGDLTVSIKEADGSVHGFTQAYSTLPVMQREGHLEYEVAAGRYRQNGGYTEGNRSPLFAMGTLIYGLPHNVTAYGGVLAAQQYAAVTAGTGISLGEAGAVSADATVSRTQLPDSKNTVSGESYRVRYSKSMLSTGTTLDLAALRYSTRQFYSFQDANSQGFKVQDGLMPWMDDRRRSSLQMSISQTLWSGISLYLSGMRDDYWGGNHANTTLSAGLGGSWHQVGWNLNYSVDRIRGNGDWPVNRQLGLSLNVPMSLFGSYAALQSGYVNYSMNHDSQGRTSNQVGLSGNLLTDNSLSWNVSQSQANQGQGSNSAAGVGYSGSMGQANIGYSHSSGYSNVNYGVSGGLLVHPYGVTLAQSLSDSMALVRAPGAGGVQVMNGQNIATNRWGYAVVPNLMSYRRNSVSLDPSTLPDDADLNDTTQAVYPTQGAVVLANYRVRRGQQVLMTLMHNGKPVPFGAMAAIRGDSEQQDAAIVGDEGQVYLNGLAQKGALAVKWGSSPDSQCAVNFDLGAPDEAKDKKGSWTPMKQVSEVCQ